MLDESRVTELKKVAAQVAEIDADALLVQRQGWGTFTFDKLRPTFEAIQRIADSLAELPIENLGSDPAREIMKQLALVPSIAEDIGNYSTSNQNPENTHQNLCHRLVEVEKNLAPKCALWLPYLAFLHGGYKAKLQGLSGYRAELDALVPKARKLVAEAERARMEEGLKKHAKNFAEQTERLASASARWLAATVVLAVVTLTVASFLLMGGTHISFGGVSFTMPQATQNVEATAHQDWLHLGLRIFILSTLLTATLWCGRMYKAIRHQWAVNKHRYLSLQTFETFTEHAETPEIRDAVLLETTRAIFGHVPTGYVDTGAAPENDGHILNIVRQLAPGRGE